MGQGMEAGAAADGDITRLLRQWSDGRDQAFRDLLPLAYDRLRLMAGARMRRERPDHTLQPTALVGELYLRLEGAKLAGWKDREHFYSFCAKAMRWILTDHAKARLRDKRRAELALPHTDELRWLGSREEDAFDLDRALSRLEEIDPRKTKILELRVYLSSTAEETAEILDLSKATVDREMRLAPAKAGDVIVLYGVGFGPVNPSIPEGQIVQQQNALPSFGISIGGAPAAVRYAGLAPNYVGLYQFNVVVPEIAANNAAPVTFQVGGTAGTQTLYLAVQ